MQGLLGDDATSRTSQGTGGQDSCTPALALALTVDRTLVIRLTSLDLIFLLYQPRVPGKMSLSLS